MASQSRKAGEDREQSALDFAGRQSEMFSADFSFSGYERDLVAWNLGNGHFLDISGVSGADSVTDGRGAVFADFDNDGDLDIFLRAMHGRAHHLFRNRIGERQGFVRVTLQGTQSGRDAFGAVVRVKTSAGIQTQIKSGGGGFLSQSDPRMLFGLGADARAESVEVRWPSGATQRFPGPTSGSSLILVEGKDDAQNTQLVRFELPDPLTTAQRLSRALGVKLRHTLPVVTVGELAGATVPMADLLGSGRPTLVNFWATWCQSCLAEMPELQKLHQGAGPAGLRIIGISIDDADRRTRIPAFIERTGTTYPIYTIDTTELHKLFKSPNDMGLPVSLLLDGQSRVVDVFQGWTAESQRRITGLAHPAPSP